MGSFGVRVAHRAELIASNASQTEPRATVVYQRYSMYLDFFRVGMQQHPHIRTVVPPRLGLFLLCYSSAGESVKGSRAPLWY